MYVCLIRWIAETDGPDLFELLLLMDWLQQSSFLILRFWTMEVSENKTRTLTVSGDGTGRTERNRKHLVPVYVRA